MRCEHSARDLKPHASASLQAPCREERLKYAIPVGFRDPVTVVSNLNGDGLSIDAYR
jgi:hypothetical protein